MSDFITVAELRIEAERLCDENERLEADNAKLQNDADLLRSMLQVKREDTHALMAENAGLRTALSAVLQCSGITKRDKGCDACPMYDKEKEYAWAGDWCGIRKFIRELGVDA